LGVISNFDERLESILRNTELEHLFDFVVVSRKVGMAKPQPQIFEHALKKTGVSPQELLHIGDSFKRDYKGATDAGMRAVLLNRESTAEAPPAEKISSLTEILA